MRDASSCCSPAVCLSASKKPMHALYSAVLASLFAQNSRTLVRDGGSVPFDSVAEYWCSSRSRIDLWEQAIIRLQRAEKERDYALLEDWWKQHAVLLEEVLVTEILTRIIAAAVGDLLIADRESKAAPVADSIFLLHHDLSGEVRRATLRHQLGAAKTYFQRLNRIRIAAQHWTDNLLGWMSVRSDQPLNYVFNEETALDFRDQMVEFTDRPIESTIMQLSSHSLFAKMQRLVSRSCALPQANYDVLNSSTSLISVGLFDERGVIPSQRGLLGMISKVGADLSPSGPHFDWNQHLGQIQFTPLHHHAAKLTLAERWNA